MLTCRKYIFKLTSGQLEAAGKLDRLLAWQHLLICRRCRAFTANDRRLSKWLAAHRQHILRADEP